MERQERFCIEGCAHRAADRVTREDSLLFKLIQHLKRAPHNRKLADSALEISRDLKLVRCPRSLAPTVVTPVRGS
jgi:hypothetical protein